MSELREFELRRNEEARLRADEQPALSFEELPYEELPFYIPRD